MISGLFSLEELFLKSWGLFVKLTLYDLLSKFKFIIFSLELLKFIGEPLSVFRILVLLHFTLVHEFLLHLIDLDLSLFSSYNRFSVRAL